MAQSQQGQRHLAPPVGPPSLALKVSSLLHTSLIWLLARLTTSGGAGLAAAALHERIEDLGQLVKPVNVLGFFCNRLHLFVSVAVHIN